MKKNSGYEGMTGVFAGVWPTDGGTGLNVYGLEPQNRMSEEQLSRIDDLLVQTRQMGIEFAKEHWGTDDPYGYLGMTELMQELETMKRKNALLKG